MLLSASADRAKAPEGRFEMRGKLDSVINPRAFVCASLHFLFLSPLVTQLWTSSAPSTCTTRPRWRSFSLTWCSTSAAWCCTAPRPYPSGSRSFSTASSPCWSRKRCCTSCTAWAGPSETTSGATYCRSVTSMHAAAPNTCKASYGFSVNVKTGYLPHLLSAHTRFHICLQFWVIFFFFFESGDNVHGDHDHYFLTKCIYKYLSHCSYSERYWSKAE